MAFKVPEYYTPRETRYWEDETGQYLHAYYLSFIHPKTNERMAFKAPMPEYMIEYIKSKGGHFFGE